MRRNKFNIYIQTLNEKKLISISVNKSDNVWSLINIYNGDFDIPNEHRIALRVESKVTSIYFDDEDANLTMDKADVHENDRLTYFWSYYNVDKSQLINTQINSNGEDVRAISYSRGSSKY